MRGLAAILAATACAGSVAATELEIREIETELGIRAWLAEDHLIPFVALELLFPGGAALEPADKAGATYLMAGLLEEGAGDLPAADFQRRQDELAARFGFDASYETVAVSARFLTENREDSVELLRLALERPRFDPEPLERVRAQVLSIIADRARNPGEIGSDALRRMAYGDHSLGRPVEGNAESIAQLEPADMRDIHRRTLTRTGVVVGAAGDITAEELAALLDDLLGGLPEARPDGIGEAEFLLEGGLTEVEFPTPQATVQFMHEGFLRDDPDFLAAFVLNEILGSSLTGSRLWTELRERRGLTYGVGTWLGAHSSSGFIAGQFSTDAESVAESVEVLRAEWARLAEEGVSEEELERVKTYLTGAYPLRFDGNAAIARILARMQFDDLPASYVAERNDMVRALSVADVGRVAKRLLKPDNLHVVAVGRK